MTSHIVNILERFLGSHKKHNENKSQVSFDCPACSADKYMSEGDGKGKLEINYKKGVFKCWVCAHTNNMHGPIEKLIKRYGNKNILRDYELVKPENNYETNIVSDENIQISLPSEFIPLSKNNSTKQYYNYAKQYLKDRGITDEIIKEYNIGYAYEGKYKNRIIIPSYDEYGDLNFFVSRSFRKWIKPKYLNPDVEKQNIVFNENRINFDATIYLVEGPFDHIVTPNSLCLLGKTLPRKIKNLLLEKSNADIVIVLDPDAFENSIEIYNELNFGRLHGRIKLCIPPEGHDSSSIFQRLGSRGVIKLLKSAKIFKK
jgi:DNA primase